MGSTEPFPPANPGIQLELEGPPRIARAQEPRVGACAHARCPGCATGSGLLLAGSRGPPCLTSSGQGAGTAGVGVEGSLSPGRAAWDHAAPSPSCGPSWRSGWSGRHSGQTGTRCPSLASLTPPSHSAGLARAWISWPGSDATCNYLATGSSSSGVSSGPQATASMASLPSGPSWTRCWQLASRAEAAAVAAVARLARAVARARALRSVGVRAPQWPAAAAQHGQRGQRGARRQPEASPGVRKPLRAGARRAGRAVGAGPGTLHPCACAGASRGLRGLGWRWLGGPG